MWNELPSPIAIECAELLYSHARLWAHMGLDGAAWIAHLRKLGDAPTPDDDGLALAQIARRTSPERLHLIALCAAHSVEVERARAV